MPRSNLLHCFPASTPREFFILVALPYPYGEIISSAGRRTSHSTCAYTLNAMPDEATESRRKYTTIAMVVLAVLVAVAIGDAYFKTRHTERKALSQRSSLSTMSIQELSRRSKECDESRAAREPGKPDSDYCTAVWREIEARPLQIVEPPAGADGDRGRVIQ
jgi:hypothetical protein